MIPVKRPLPGRPQPVARAASYASLPKQKRMTKRRWIALGAVLMFLVLGAGVFAWAAGYLGSDPKLAELNNLRDKMMDPSLSDKDKQTLGQEMRKKFEALTPEQRQAAWQSGGEDRQKMEAKRMADFFALPPDKQIAELNKDIDRQLEGMKRFEQMMKDNAKNGAPPGAGPGGPRGPGMWGGGPPGSGNPNAWRNRILSSVPADARAQRTIYRQLVQAQANQRGVTLPQWGGPR